MVVKVYVSGISGNKEVKKRQQRVLMILDSKNIKYEVIDIAEPGKESDKDFMQNNSKSKGGTVSDPNPRSPLPPQIFNEEEYCGDYDQFDLANEVDTLEQFLKLELPAETPTSDDTENKAESPPARNNRGNLSEKYILGTCKTPSKLQRLSFLQLVAKTINCKCYQENTANGDVSTKEKSAERDSVERTQENATGDSTQEDSIVKAESEKEITPERKMSVDAVPEESKEKSTEETDVELVEEISVAKEEAINENGAVSSREISEEKESQEVIEQKKENPTEALLESEKKENPTEALLESEKAAASD